ncbi:hypothetical protein [Pseudomonas sp. TSPC2-1]|uniref:hypothetical protein n=1 Tax=Pseudomonas sp. TSPC2-1 TaxID=2804663 RepID=UPI003CEFD391
MASNQLEHQFSKCWLGPLIHPYNSTLTKECNRMGFYIEGMGEAVISLQNEEFQVDSNTLKQGDTVQTSQQAYDEDDVDFETSFFATSRGETTEANQLFTWKVEYTQDFSTGKLFINAAECVTPGVIMIKDLAFSAVAEHE